MTTPNTTLIFHLASTPKRPETPLAQVIRKEAGMTITVEDQCLGKAMELADFIKEALEFAGTTGAEHASKGVVAWGEEQGRYTSIRIEHTPTQKPNPVAAIPCRHANFGL